MSNPVERCMERRDRILHLIKLLIEGPNTVPFASLAHKLDVSIDTVRRDLKLLESVLCSNHKYFELDYGNVRTYFQKSIAPLSEDLQLFLLIALKQMEYFLTDEEGLRIDSKIKSFIRNSVDEEDEIKWGDMEEFIIFSQFSNPIKRATFYNDVTLILRAINQNKLISALKEERRRYLDPFAIYYAKNTFYLVAQEYELIRDGSKRIPIQKSELRHYRLDRLNNFSIEMFQSNRSLKSKRDRALRYTNLMWEAEGPQIGAKDSIQIESFTLHLEVYDPKIWKRLKERRWGTRQTFLETNNDYCGVLYIDNVTSHQEVKKWILSWGSDVKVREPEWLREEIINEAKKMLSRY